MPCRNLGLQLTVQEGDSIESLSAKFGISEAKLRKANGGKLPHGLHR